MSKFSDLVETRIKESFLENLRTILKEEKDVKKKIDTHCENFGIFNSDDIWYRISNGDELLASFFIKPPSKQNIPEKMFFELTGETKAPSKGLGCIRFDKEGNLIKDSPALDDLTKFKDNVFIENISSWDNKEYLQSVQAHKDVNDKAVILEEDFFKPLIGQFINNLSKDKKAEFLLKVDSP